MDVNKVIAKLNSLSSDVGAVVVFTGVVRSEKGRVKRLEYEVYREMFEKVVKEIKREAEQKFPILGIEIEHKFGSFPPGEVVFLVAVAAEHRKEAFEACSWAVDEFKRRAPVWKKEITSAGERWLQ